VPEPIRLLILDNDGILVDSEPIAVRVDMAVLAELGWTLPPEEVVERFTGRTEAVLLEAAEAHLGRPLPDGWADERRRRFRAAFEAELRPVEGIVAALDAISIPTCVASSGGHDKIEHSLRLCGLYERFAGRIFSGTEVAHGKPAPDLFLHAASQLGVAPADCVVVEDSPAGVAAARAAGMRVLAYAGGVIPAARLTAATAVFDDMSRLPGLLEVIGVASSDAGASDGATRSDDGTAASDGRPA
jgi:HAD superfamily hydrolase (TIGR01509 family)